MTATARKTLWTRRFGVGFLLAEAVCVVLWWVMLLLLPQTRPLFMARNSPDAALFAFGIADMTLFAGAAAVSIVAYAVIGGIVWHFFVRPWEEADLEARFGEPYCLYRAAVRCWIPRLRPYDLVP